MLNAKDAMHSLPNSTLRLETGVLDASSSASRTPVPESNASTSTASTIPS